MKKHKKQLTVSDDENHQVPHGEYKKKKVRRNLELASNFFYKKDDVIVVARLGDNEYCNCEICGDEPRGLVVYYIYLCDTQAQHYGGTSMTMCGKCNQKIQARIDELKHSSDVQDFHKEVQVFKSKINRE
jgi:hypothetical protein